MSPTADTEYDIVFAGGGAAACVIAGRLSQADPSLKILVLEAGPHTRALQAHTQPARSFSHLAPTSHTVTFNVAKPSEHLRGRSLVTASGRCVGGGSSVNLALYNRAPFSDYDDWVNVYQNDGWGSEDLLPLLKKTETYQVKPGEPTHGYEGPLKVSYGGTFTNVGKQFLEVAAQYDKERKVVEDINDFSSGNVYGRWQKWIDGEKGTRSDAAHHFIYNQEDNKNLQVLDGSRVKRVVFEHDRAVGVEYVNNAVLDPAADQTVHVARASRLVIVTAGAFGSPAILERSGIGTKGIVEHAGIKCIIDLPGVGESYQDHNFLFTPYLASEDAETLDAFFRGEKDEVEKLNTLWTKEGKGLMAHNGLDAGGKLRPSAEELKEFGLDFKERWDSYFANVPDRPVICITSFCGYLGDHSIAAIRKYCSVGYFTGYPVALGSVHIKSDDPHGAPDFDPRFLNNKVDLAVLRWAYKTARELARRMGVYRGELVSGHPKFKPDSDAYCRGEVNGPVDVGAPTIQYTKEDDEAIDEYHRDFIQSSWHSLGTCAMKPREQGGVVDHKLNVYGVQGLKVADLSIAPGNVGVNTYSTALVIGEKAATIIIEELGIKAV